jgi:hypothetical protein
MIQVIITGLSRKNFVTDLELYREKYDGSLGIMLNQYRYTGAYENIVFSSSGQNLAREKKLF